PAIAAQDSFWEKEGPYTGAVSPIMLLEFGTEYCIVGHSDRRKYMGETDEMIAKKAQSLQAEGIKPVICVGETAAERKKGDALKVVRAQLRAAISKVKTDSKTPIIIAYEPVWAIGTGKPCSTQIAQEMHEAIRTVLQKKFNSAADDIQVIYGGSVEPRNILDYMTTTGIDGALVGGASLDPRNFGLLCRAAVPA
ncbi:triose-phosphate isomerase, partial [Patescibacteria group bacterium]|nr:triose-phosphate isomerase [Patescibacteria group bacterium]